MSSPASDPRLCPLCGRANSCVMEQPREPGEDPPACWCTNVDFTSELLGQVPAEAQDLACICPACARATAQA